MSAMTVRRRCLKATASVAFACTVGAVGLVAAAPAAFAAPSVAVVSSSSYGPQSDGFLYIVGEAKNTGSTPIAGIAVTIGLYDAANTLITTDDVTTQVSGLAPGEKGGFVDIVTPPGGYTHYKILGASAVDAPAAPYHRFRVSNVQNVADATGVHDISGTVTNTGYYMAQNVRLSFTFYNQAGTVVDVDTQPLSVGTLNIATSGTFDEHNIPAAIHFSSFVVLVEGAVNAPPCGPCVPFPRVAGATRIGTSIASSQDEFPTAGSASAVVLASSEVFADALSGGPLAAHVKGPLLITAKAALDPAILAEIRRVAPAGATVDVLGGPVALSPSIDAALSAAGFKPVRIAGANRFGTAVAIAGALGNPGVVFEASGLNYPDALSGGPAAIVKGAAMLLTNGTSQAAETAAYLAAHAGATRYALGGPAAAADTHATPLVGADRYATSAAVARTFFPAPTQLGLASALGFPDALSAGPNLGGKNAPLLLVPPASPLSGAYATYFASVAPGITAGLAFGGTAALGASVVTETQDALFSMGAT